MEARKKKRQHLFQKREKPPSEVGITFLVVVHGPELCHRITGSLQERQEKQDFQLDTSYQTRVLVTKGERETGYLVDNYRVSQNLFSENISSLSCI